MLNFNFSKDHVKYVIPALVFGLIGIIYLTIYAGGQYILRQSANDPQIQMAEDLTVLLAAGVDPIDVAPKGSVDMERSLAPFVIIFDQSKKPVISSAAIEGKIPVPPAGVFSYSKRFGEDRFTWQPKKGVRAAVIMKYYSGNNPGFVLTGRSLRQTEERETFLMLAIFISFIGSIVVTGFGMFLLYKFNWQDRSPLIPK